MAALVKPSWKASVATRRTCSATLGEMSAGTPGPVPENWPAVLAARLHAALSASVIVLGFSWIAAIMTLLMIAVPGGLALGAILGVVAFFAPVANTTIITYQMMITPDELRGRLAGITGLSAGAAGALGPLLGGILMTAAGGSTGVLLCAAALTAVAIGATLNPTLRRFPTLRATKPG